MLLLVWGSPSQTIKLTYGESWHKCNCEHGFNPNVLFDYYRLAEHSYIVEQLFCQVKPNFVGTPSPLQMRNGQSMTRTKTSPRARHYYSVRHSDSRPTRKQHKPHEQGKYQCLFERFSIGPPVHLLVTYRIVLCVPSLSFKKYNSSSYTNCNTLV